MDFQPLQREVSSNLPSCQLVIFDLNGLHCSLFGTWSLGHPLTMTAMPASHSYQWEAIVGTQFCRLDVNASRCDVDSWGFPVYKLRFDLLQRCAHPQPHPPYSYIKKAYPRAGSTGPSKTPQGATLGAAPAFLCTDVGAKVALF